MSEITIPQALSGIEIIDAILHKIHMSLVTDCYLNPNSAYESFTCDVRIRVRAKDLGRMVEIKQAIDVASETTVSEDELLQEAELHLYEQPPNQVRRDAGLPIPTMVTDAQGRKEVKPIRYRRPE